MTPLITPAEWARSHHFSRQYAHQLIREGIIPTHKGMINKNEADRALNAHQDPARVRFKQKGENSALQNPTSDNKTVSGKLSSADLPTLLMTTRIKNFAERNKLLALEHQLKTGALIEASEVKASAFQKGRILRDRLLTIPDRLAPQFACLTDATVIYDLLSREIRQALDDLSSDDESRPSL
jgi:hypothetical protein